MAVGRPHLRLVRRPHRGQGHGAAPEVVLAIVSAARVGAGPSRGLRTVSHPGHRAPSGGSLPRRTGPWRLAGAASGTWPPTRRRPGLRPPPPRVGHRAEGRSRGLQPTPPCPEAGCRGQVTPGVTSLEPGALEVTLWVRTTETLTGRVTSGT